MSGMRLVAMCFAILAAAMSTMAQEFPRGQGAFKNPFEFQSFASVGDGISLRAVEMQRPADVGAGMESPPEGQEYVIVSIELNCAADRSENCLVASWDFEVAGDNGIIYPNLAATDERAFDIDPDTEASGDILALVNTDDGNLVLLFYHWPTIPFTFPLVFATEAAPAPGPTIAVTASIGMIARVGPGKNLDFTGVFNRGEQVLAQGRTRDGNWLEIAFGWIPAALVDAEGDIMSLPITFE